MTNDLMLGGVYILMAVMLVLGSLMARREPLAKMLTIALAWVAIFAAGFVLFTFRDNFGWVAQRLKAEAVGTPVQQGRETRIPMAIDGHFWVEARLNGQKVRFLVDSGATMTTVDRQTALKPACRSRRSETSSSAPATGSSGCRAAARPSSRSAGSRAPMSGCKSPTMTI